jgi:flagellar M-ring protein FliF
MKFDLGAVFGQMVQNYVRLPLAQKIALPLLFAGCMGIIVFVSNWASRPDYRVLFSGLSDADAAGIVEKLRDQKVGYRLTNDGKTIEVTPPSRVDEVRLELSAAGLPKGGNIGFEIFDSNVLGRTGFAEKLAALRGKQGELERTIGTIEAIKNVRIHITEPERSAFVKRDILPTASVLLRLKVGSELTKDQIKGIANLVANSVERLVPDNVTILDSKGNLLNTKTENDELGGTEITRLDYKSKVEQSYAKQIESMLAGILGQGKAIARVTADLDFSKFEKEEEQYDPSSRVTRSERSIDEGGSQSAEGGVPGVLSNLTNDPNLLAAPDSGKGSKHSEVVRNFEVSRAVTKTMAAPGRVQKLSVAVLVDGLYHSVASANKDAAGAPIMEKQFKPLPIETVKKIENLVKQTVGFDASRGDIVSIENIKFADTDDRIEEILNANTTTDNVKKIVDSVGPVLFVLLFFGIIVRPLLKFVLSPTEAEVDLSRLLPAGVEELEAELEAERQKVASVPQIQTQSVDIEELEALLASNSRMVKDNPQQAALLIRYWLNDGRM